VTSLPILTFLLLLPTIEVRAEEAETTAEQAIASLTDPKKLATLKGERASNPRFQKCLYWLAIGEAMSKERGGEEMDGVVKVIEEASRLNKTLGTPYASAIKDTLVSNYVRALLYDIFNPAGLEELRQGKSATISRGEYEGQEATADHCIPRSVCPELDNQIFNLRLLPSKLNSSKGDKVGREELDSAEWFSKRGLLSTEGLEAVRKAYERDSH